MTIDNRPILPEVDVEPLGDIMLDFLIERDKEEAFLDFKETLSVSHDAPFAKIAKDIFAFANYGGGFFLIGFKPKPKPQLETPEPLKNQAAEEKPKASERNFIPVGLPEEFQIDQAVLQEKFNSYSSSPIHIQYRGFSREFDGVARKLVAVYVPASTSVLKPTKDGVYTNPKGKIKTAFKAGDVLFRRGTQSIVAIPEEAKYITRRAETEGYRLSVLSGEPDRIQETLYSNLFEVVKIPEVIWTASTKPPEKVKPRRPDEILYRAVYVRWGGKMLTFDDLSRPESPLGHLIDPASVEKQELNPWLADPDRQRIIIFLLNKEICFLAESLGFFHEPKREKFYYPCQRESRTEIWVPRYKSSSKLTVAQRIFAQQLGRFIYWHVAVIAHFVSLEDRLFLALNPTIQLTNDGMRAIFGQDEGTVITRLTYNRYNSSYLNSLLFWISKLAGGQDAISLAQGGVKVSTKTMESRIGVGIMSDRPAAEPTFEIPDIEIGGKG